MTYLFLFNRSNSGPGGPGRIVRNGWPPLSLLCFADDSTSGVGIPIIQVSKHTRRKKEY